MALVYAGAFRKRTEVALLTPIVCSVSLEAEEAGCVKRPECGYGSEDVDSS